MSADGILGAIEPANRRASDQSPVVERDRRQGTLRLRGRHTTEIDARGEHLLGRIEEHLRPDWLRSYGGGWVLFPVGLDREGGMSASGPLAALPRPRSTAYKVRIFVETGRCGGERPVLAFRGFAEHAAGCTTLVRTRSLAEALNGLNAKLRQRQRTQQLSEHGCFELPYLQLDPDGVAEHLQSLAAELPRWLRPGAAQAFRA